MSRTVKLIIACLALAGACLAFTPDAPRAQQAQAPAAPRTLTEQERRGKQVYLRGEGAAGREIVAVVGEIDVPGSTVTCAGCHGAGGEGKTEGGVTAGNLTWSNLLKPYGHTHPSGRKHGPFTESSFIRAVTGGVDPDGNEMLVAMPRYRLAPEDMADLIAYLKRIEFDRDPGLTENSIKVGAVIPATGPLAEMGAAMRDVLSAYFDELNARGGIYSRKVELKFAATGADAASTAANAKALAEREQLFAFVGGVSAGAERELAALAAEHETPFVGPATLLPQTDTPLNRQVFYFMPGVAEQSRALANFAAARPELKGAAAAVVHAGGELYASAAAAAADQLKQAGAPAPARHTYARGAFDAAALVRQLKPSGAKAVFFFGAGGDEAALLREASAAGWTPHVFLLGSFAGPDASAAVTPAFKDKVFLSFPSVPSDVTPEGMAEFRALHAKYKFAARHTSSQLAAFAAARTFAEALKRAGQDLSRERLIAALEGLYDFETGVTPHLTFGPNRRVGAAGAYVVTVDPEKKQYAPVGGWVKASSN